ncbi:MAG: hypothetical protein AB9873_13035 [Syntrophobacteraceae bacterium]
MGTIEYFGIFFSYCLVAWIFYKKGARDAIGQILAEEENRRHQEMWNQMTNYFGG